MDGTEQSWASEPARVNDVEFWWEDYRTALHAESLLESLAENLYVVSTLPAAFRIVDARLAPSS